jgi:hypothetical protein
VAPAQVGHLNAGTTAGQATQPPAQLGGGAIADLAPGAPVGHVHVNGL